MFLKEDTKRHRKTLWKSGSITIAEKSKTEIRRNAGLFLCHERRRPSRHTDPSVPVPIRNAAPYGLEEHQKIITSNYNRHERDPKSRRRYGRAWRRIRDGYLSKHPMCEKYQQAGKLTAAAKVYHIKPLSQGGTHAEENLMALCKKYNSEITAREGGR